MTDDYGCKVCGKHFEEEEDLKSHGKDDHPEVNEAYPEVFDKKTEQQWQEDYDKKWDVALPDKDDAEEERKAVGISPLTGKTAYKDVDDADEIDQQVDKPVQSHDDWVKELEGLQDEFSKEGGAGSGPQEGSNPSLLPEQTARSNITPNYNPFKPTPQSNRLQTDPALSRTTEGDELVWNGEHYVKAKEQEDDDEHDDEYDDKGYHKRSGTADFRTWQKRTGMLEDKDDAEEARGDPLQVTDDGYFYDGDIEDIDKEEMEKYKKEHPHGSGESPAEEEGGADDPLKKVADLAENYKYMSRDSRISLFESLKFTQGDSAILSGLEWNELTRPIKVEASEAYVKEQTDVPDEEYEQEQKEEAKQQADEDEAYEVLYNLEKYHDSADYKKKSLTCNRCNEAFYNTNDRNIHYNDVHATEQEYKLPETCPYCNIEINEPDNLDWHMQEEHGAHVPSQYTQTGLQGAMADTDFDSLESHKRAKEGNLNDSELNLIFSDYKNSEEPPYSEQGFQDFVETNYPYMLTPHESRTEFSEWTGESYKKKAGERSEYFINSFTAPSQRVGNFDTYWRCHICGADVDGEELEQHYDQHEDAGDIPHFESRKKKANERSIEQACKNAGCTVERAQQVADAQGMDLQQVVDAGNLEEMIYSQDQDEYSASHMYESRANERMVDVDDYGIHYNHFIEPPTEDNDYNYDPREGYKAEEEDDTGARVIKPGDPDYEKEMAIQASWNELGASIKAQGLSKDELKKRGIVFLESHKKKASEDSIYGSVIDDHFDEQYVMDQDGMYKCEHCGAWLDVHNIGSFSPEEVAKHHLETEHGITESRSYAREFMVVCPKCSQTYNHLKTGGICEYCGADNRKFYGESRASDLRKEIKDKTNFINMASFENPMNMGDDQAQLEALKDELESLGGEELESTEDVELVPDKGKFLNMMTDMQAPPEKEAEEQEEVECEDCGEKFNDSAQLEEHQYANWHGKHKDDYEGQDMPRNVMGGQ